MVCKKCGNDLPLTAEYWTRSAKDPSGLRLWRCRDCVNEYNRITAAKPAAVKRKAEYQKSHPRDPELKSKSSQKYRKNHPHKIRAHIAVQEAKRKGLIKPKPCEMCGKYPTQAHHIDYSRPLDVIWLCHWCHTRVHHSQEQAA